MFHCFIIRFIELMILDGAIVQRWSILSSCHKVNTSTFQKNENYFCIIRTSKDFVVYQCLVQRNEGCKKNFTLLQVLSIVTCPRNAFQRIDKNDDGSMVANMTRIFLQCSIDTRGILFSKDIKDQNLRKCRMLMISLSFTMFGRNFRTERIGCF